MPNISVIIPSFNRVDALRQNLTSLAHQTLPPSGYEVIVVDDGSTDGSLDIVGAMETPYNLRLLRQANQGAGAARNAGAQHARADYLVFLDADMLAAPDLLSEYMEAKKANPNALVIGRQGPLAEVYNTLFDRVTRYESNFDLGVEPVSLSFYHVLSGNMAIAKSAYEVLGGFDARVGTGAKPATDDTDFGYRTSLAGISLVYWPAALARHNHPRTFEQRCWQEYVVAFWTAKMFDRYPEMVGLIPVFRETQPIELFRESFGLSLAKSVRHATSLRPALAAMNLLRRMLERWFPDSQMLPSVYWGLLGGYRCKGFRAGRRFANSIP